jgi:hypothetical protein
MCAVTTSAGVQRHYRTVHTYRRNPTLYLPYAAEILSDEIWGFVC